MYDLLSLISFRFVLCGPLQLVDTFETARIRGLGMPMKMQHEEMNGLIQQYNSPLLNFVRSRMDSSNDAEDIVQETWIRSLNAFATGAVENFRAYLYRVARNLIADHFRSGLKMNAADESAMLTLRDERSDLEKQLLHAEELAAIEEALESMPSRAREVFLLIRIEELTYAEAGRRLGISRQTVHEHMVNALRLLQHSLELRARKDSGKA